jgi:hypothetical protein
MGVFCGALQAVASLSKVFPHAEEAAESNGLIGDGLSVSAIAVTDLISDEYRQRGYLPIASVPR